MTCAVQPAVSKHTNAPCVPPQYTPPPDPTSPHPTPPPSRNKHPHTHPVVHLSLFSPPSPPPPSPFPCRRHAVGGQVQAALLCGACWQHQPGGQPAPVAVPVGGGALPRRNTRAAGRGGGRTGQGHEQEGGAAQRATRHRQDKQRTHHSKVRARQPGRLLQLLPLLFCTLFWGRGVAAERESVCVCLRDCF